MSKPEERQEGGGQAETNQARTRQTGQTGQAGELRNKILNLLPSTLPATLGREVKDSIEAAIQGYFEKMNLVSRKEFEVQEKVLAKTREKLKALEDSLDQALCEIEDKAK